MKCKRAKEKKVFFSSIRVQHFQCTAPKMICFQIQSRIHHILRDKKSPKVNLLEDLLDATQ